MASFRSRIFSSASLIHTYVYVREIVDFFLNRVSKPGGDKKELNNCGSEVVYLYTFALVEYVMVIRQSFMNP